MQSPVNPILDDAFVRLQQAECEAATSPHNSRRYPTDAQAAARNYKLGRLMLHGLQIAIENPCGTIRSGTSEDGKQWSNRMAAAYGEFTGTRGADGDAVDVFIGPLPESRKVWVINQGWPDGGFDEHKVMLGFVSEVMARDAYLGSFDRGWTGLQSIAPANIEQLKWWLKHGDMARPFSIDQLPFLDGATDMNKTHWTAEAEPIGALLNKVLYDIRSDDAGQGLLLDSVTGLDEFLCDPDIERLPLPPQSMLDALVVQVSRMTVRMDQLKRVMDAAGGALSVTDYTISDPIRARGVMQVAVLFALSDGQAVTIWFHNPDTTPAKITPLDELVSWKWMLNKKDITIVVAPERGRELNPREVARRIMKLAERNSEKFQAANKTLAEKTQAIAALDTEIGALESRLTEVRGQIADAKQRKEIEAQDAARPKSQAELNAYITSAAGYATIVDDEAKLLEWQDVLDAFFQERIIAVRNALRELGWDGPAYQPLAKGLAKLQLDVVHAGSSNVVGVTYRVKNDMGGQVGHVVDTLEGSPADVAFSLDALLLTMPQPESETWHSKYLVMSFADRWRVGGHNFNPVSPSYPTKDEAEAAAAASFANGGYFQVPSDADAPAVIEDDGEGGEAEFVAAAVAAARSGVYGISRLVTSDYFTFDFDGDEPILTDELRAKVEAELGESLAEYVFPGYEGQVNLIPASAVPAPATAKPKRVTKKEASEAYDSLIYAINDLQGHTPLEFAKADVPERLVGPVTAVQALVERGWPATFVSPANVLDRAQALIDRWTVARADGADGLPGEMGRGDAITYLRNKGLSDEQAAPILAAPTSISMSGEIEVPNYAREYLDASAAAAPTTGEPMPSEEHAAPAIDWTKADEVANSFTDLAHFGEVTINDVGSENVYFIKDGKPYYTKLLNTDDYTPGQVVDFTSLRPGSGSLPAAGSEPVSPEAVDLGAEPHQTDPALLDPALAADRTYLESLIDGSGDLLAADTFEKLEPMFAAYEGNAEMIALLERAATAYGDAAQAEAQKALAA